MIFESIGWATHLQDLQPGAYILAYDVDPLEGRRAGLEVRDTLLVAGPEGVSVIVIFRVPMVESTVVAQVLKTGTGALFIDGCRSIASEEDAEAMQRCNSPGSGRMYASSSPIGTFTRSSSSGALDTSKGRWPTNLVFVHQSGCVKEGPTTWECGAGCLVEALDTQSGDRRSAGLYPTSYSHSEGYHGGIGLVQGPLYEDSGGAARFFPQLANDVELKAWLTRLVVVGQPTP